MNSPNMRLNRGENRRRKAGELSMVSGYDEAVRELVEAEEAEEAFFEREMLEAGIKICEYSGMPCDGLLVDDKDVPLCIVANGSGGGLACLGIVLKGGQDYGVSLFEKLLSQRSLKCCGVRGQTCFFGGHSCDGALIDGKGVVYCFVVDGSGDGVVCLRVRLVGAGGRWGMTIGQKLKRQRLCYLRTSKEVKNRHEC